MLGVWWYPGSLWELLGWSFSGGVQCHAMPWSHLQEEEEEVIRRKSRWNRNAFPLHKLCVILVALLPTLIKPWITSIILNAMLACSFCIHFLYDVTLSLRVQDRTIVVDAVPVSTMMRMVWCSAGISQNVLGLFLYNDNKLSLIRFNTKFFNQWQTYDILYSCD